MPDKLLICGAVGMILVGCTQKSAPVLIASPSEAAPVAIHPASGVERMTKQPMHNTDPAEAMRGLRLQALATSAGELGLKPSAEFPRVYGVLMEWNLGKSTATLTSFATGDASLYTSAGYGVIGGVTHERVRTAACRFVSAAERYYDAAIPAEEFPHPAEGKVRFVLLGYKGRRAIDGKVPAPTGSGPIYDLFAAGQGVLTQLRLISEAGHG